MANIKLNEHQRAAILAVLARRKAAGLDPAFSQADCAKAVGEAVAAFCEDYPYGEDWEADGKPVPFDSAAWQKLFIERYAEGGLLSNASQCRQILEKLDKGDDCYVPPAKTAKDY